MEMHLYCCVGVPYVRQRNNGLRATVSLLVYLQHNNINEKKKKTFFFYNVVCVCELSKAKNSFILNLNTKCAAHAL